MYLFLRQETFDYLKFNFLNTKNLKEIKLKGAIIGIGINFAIIGSTPAEIKVLSNNVLRLQKVVRLIRYFIPVFA